MRALVKNLYNPKILFEAAGWGRASSVDEAGQYNALSTGYGFQRGNYLVGIGISYDLFDLRRRQLKLHTQEASTDYAYKKLQEQQQLLSISDSQADVEMQTALNRLKEIPKQLKAANDSYRQNLSLYKNGLSDIITLDAALNILYRAETDFMQAKYDYSSALFQKAITENQVNHSFKLIKIINYVNGHIRTQKAHHGNSGHHEPFNICSAQCNKYSDRYFPEA